jgi:hypothetical protein
MKPFMIYLEMPKKTKRLKTIKIFSTTNCIIIVSTIFKKPTPRY